MEEAHGADLGATLERIASTLDRIEQRLDALEQLGREAHRHAADIAAGAAPILDRLANHPIIGRMIR